MAPAAGAAAAAGAADGTAGIIDVAGGRSGRRFTGDRGVRVGAGAAPRARAPEGQDARDAGHEQAGEAERGEPDRERPGDGIARASRWRPASAASRAGRRRAASASVRGKSRGRAGRRPHRASPPPAATRSAWRARHIGDSDAWPAGTATHHGRPRVGDRREVASGVVVRGVLDEVAGFGHVVAQTSRGRTVVPPARWRSADDGRITGPPLPTRCATAPAAARCRPRSMVPETGSIGVIRVSGVAVALSLPRRRSDRPRRSPDAPTGPVAPARGAISDVDRCRAGARAARRAGCPGRWPRAGRPGRSWSARARAGRVTASREVPMAASQRAPADAVGGGRHRPRSG